MGKNNEITKYTKRLTPLMGWASWNNYRININEALLKEQVDALISTGLAEVGYTYFNIDDGFFYGRDENGRIKAHPERFPNGMKVMSDYIHSKGLKAGIYSEAGENTCAHIYDNPNHNKDGVGVGLYGHDEEDLRMYLIEWDYDFIKVDWCGGLTMGLDEQTRYTEISNIIQKLREEKNSDIIYNVCRWKFPGEWVVDVADSWRISGDIGLNFESILSQVDAAKTLAAYHGPGHVNDLDMLQVGRGLSYEEDKTHFAMWCMMSTPLMLGNDLTTISEETLSIIKNTELIAINQDPACLQANLMSVQGDIEVWVKDLGSKNSNQKAIAILNRSNEESKITIQWSDFGVSSVIAIRDLWEHEEIEVDESNSVTVPAHGTCMYKITAQQHVEDYAVENKKNSDSIPKECFYINAEMAKARIKEGTILIDVRTEEEYRESHLEGAIHIAHTDLLREATSVIPNKETEIIVYCTAKKRAVQARNHLCYMGYVNVYVLENVSLRRNKR